jgi:NADPH:quinone reductase-like Zn-dependent oxidoreductase
VDYTRADYLRSEAPYDVVFQLAGTRSPADCRRALTRNGTLVLSSGDSPGRWLGPFDRVFQALLLGPFVSQRLKVLQTSMRGRDLGVVRDMLEASTLTPVIDRTYPLCELPEAIRYVERGHAPGQGGDPGLTMDHSVASAAISSA